MSTHLRTHAKPAPPTSSFTPVSFGVLQRKCACGGTPGPDGECAECRKERLNLQRSATGPLGPSTLPSLVHDVLRSPGQPLDSATRVYMEPRFGHDFSQVRVHTDAWAAESAQAVNALAYTVGQHVVFGNGQFAPDSREGQQLIAHELTHTIQQRAGVSLRLQKQADEDTAADELEEEADEAEAIAAQADGGKKVPAKPKKAKPACTRTILAEGTCQDLVRRSKYRCCDPDNGIEHPDVTKDIEGKSCPSEKFTPIFSCDNNCKTALAKGCSDDDNWMAIPKQKIGSVKCGAVFTICANGKQTQGYYRDNSSTETRFEVSPKIQKDLGVTVGDSFKGAIYRPGAKQAIIDKDPCCKA
jgi:Domain of unknown function (DUF4157)